MDDKALLSLREHHLILRSELETRVSTFKSHWRDLANFILPRRIRIFTKDANKGDKRNQNIRDSTATLASRTAKSGMMSGITNPATQWFKIGVANPSIEKLESVARWCQQVTDIMHAVMQRSNYYNSLSTVYGDILTFGTGCIYIEEDVDKVFRTYAFPIGSYWLALNEKLEVDTFHREFTMTVRQIVQRWGMRRNGTIDWSKISDCVKALWNAGSREVDIDICHTIEPNPFHDDKKLLSKYKKYLSSYYEKGTEISGGTSYSAADKARYLQLTGYDYFPVLAPRWEVTGEDVYGTDCPGITCLGDVKQLQKGEELGLQAVEKSVKPPLVGPPSLRSQKISLLSGDITYEDTREGSRGLRPIHEVDPRVDKLEVKQEQARNRINESYYVPMFRLLDLEERRQPVTATEIIERNSDRVKQIGPVILRLNVDLLDPTIDIVFTMCWRQRLLPPPPPELMGIPLRVEYISVMAQAMKAVKVQGIERFAGFVGQIVNLTQNPEHYDAVDVDKMIWLYGDATGTPLEVIRKSEDIQAIRQARAQQQQIMQRLQALEQAAGAARDLSRASMEDDNALTRMVEGREARPEAVPA